MVEVLLVLNALLLFMVWIRLGSLGDTRDTTARIAGGVALLAGRLESIEDRLTQLNDRAVRAGFQTEEEHHAELREMGVDPHSLGA